NCENEMSCAVVRCPGFWKSVNSASSNRTMITQSAKFRRLAFITRPDAAARVQRGNKHYASGSWRLSDSQTNVGSARPHEKALSLNILTSFDSFAPARSALG